MNSGYTLVERLGYPKETKLLIVNCDDLGSSNCANDAIKRCFEDNVVTSSTLMVPCPWATAGAKMSIDYDIGVHLTLNSEWDDYRWSPLTYSKTLTAAKGGFHKTVPALYELADINEVENELRAQIEQALDWGVDITHIDSHMGPLHFREDYFKLYLQLAVEFEVPMRMPNAEFQQLLGFDYRVMAQEKGVIFPDYFAFVVDGVGSRDTITNCLSELNFGVTEVYLHPVVDTEELRNMADDYEKRVDDFKFLIEDRLIETVVEKNDIKLIGYRQLRDLMRS